MKQRLAREVQHTALQHVETDELTRLCRADRHLLNIIKLDG